MEKIGYMKKLTIIYLTFLLTLSAFCQTEKQMIPSDLKQQTVVTEPVTLRKGFLRAGILLNYRVVDKYFTESGERDYPTSTWGSKSA